MKTAVFAAERRLRPMNFEIEIQEGDKIMFGDDLFRVVKIDRGDAEIQLSSGSYLDTIKSPAEFEEMLSNEDHVQIFR